MKKSCQIKIQLPYICYALILAPVWFIFYGTSLFFTKNSRRRI